MSVRLKNWPLLCGIVAAAGCVHYQPQPLAPGKTAAQFDARQMDDADLGKFIATNSGGETKTWPLETWDLNSLTLAAFYFHPDLAVARAQWRVALAGVKTAGARPNPSVSVAPGYDSQIPGNYSPWLVPVTFDLPIETAGKRGKRLIEAEKLSESARWNFVSAAWQIRGGVRSALLDFATAGQRAELLQKQFAAQKEITRLMQGRFDAGEISHPELTTAQIALNKTQIDLGDAESKKTEARSHLAEALGVGEAALDGQKFDFDFSTRDMTELTSAEARQVALRSRADILAALADYAAAEAELQLQIAKQYPDLHLGQGYAWNSGNAGDNQWSLGLTLELPLLDQNQGPIAEAKANRELSAAKFLQLQAQVSAQVDRAVAGWQSAQAQLKTAGGLLDAAQNQQKSIAAQVQSGAAERLDLFSAEIELATVQLAQIDSETQAQAALGALEDALQRPADSISAVIEKICSQNPNAKEAHP
ncbi:MAG TPA: TolC family protein [Verrucomicrobiae bacterium]